jgi:hypothetical protein
MPRTYKRISNKASWSAEPLKAAMRAILSGRRIGEVGRAFNIPESTLRDKMKNGFPSATQLGRKPVFTAEQEKELLNHILKLAGTFHDMSPTHLRKIAYVICRSQRCGT